MKTVVTMNPQGRLTVPIAARQALRIEGETLFELEATENELILRPAEAIPREDLWAYTPEHLERVKRARQGPREHDRQLSKEELEELLFGSSE